MDGKRLSPAQRRGQSAALPPEQHFQLAGKREAVDQMLDPAAARAGVGVAVQTVLRLQACAVLPIDAGAAYRFAVSTADGFHGQHSIFLAGILGSDGASALSFRIFYHIQFRNASVFFRFMIVF